MVKRGNENAQMRREDYEAQEARGGGGGGGNGGGGGDEEGIGFQRANESDMARRRIVSAKRPKNSVRGDGNGGGGGGGGGGGDKDSKKTGAFANFSFGANTPAPPPSFSFGATAAGIGVGGIGGGFKPEVKPSNNNFLFGNSGASSGMSFGAKTTTAADNTNKPFSFGGTTPLVPAPSGVTGGFNFGGSGGGSSPASVAPVGNGSSSAGGMFQFGSNNNNNNNNSSKNTNENLPVKFQKMAKQLESDFLSAISAQGDIANTDISKALDFYLDAVACLEAKYWSQEKENISSTIGGGGKEGANNPFGISNSNNLTSSNTGNSFAPSGGTTTAATDPVTPTTSGGKVGGFSFTPGSKITLGTTPATSNPFAPSTSAAADNDNTDDAAATDDNDDDTKGGALEGDADNDWTLLDTLTRVSLFKKDKVDQTQQRLTGPGTVKFQEHKENKGRRIIMRNEASGKVLFNVAVSKGASTHAYPITVSKKHPEGIETVLFLTSLDGNAVEHILAKRVYDKSKPMGPVFKTMFEGGGASLS